MNESFRFTTERRTLVQTFVNYRYLRMSHLYALYGAGDRVTCRGVRRLLHDFWAKGYLCRQISPANPSSQQRVMEFSYWLSARGARLAEDAGVVISSLPVPRPSMDRTLLHELTITDFHLSAERAAESLGMTFFWNQYGLRRGVNPDALLAITDPTMPVDAGTSYSFLEVERSRQGGYSGGKSVLLRRLTRYAAYQGSAQCLGDWQWFSEFRVLIMVTGPARRQRLLETLAGSLPLPMFWIGVTGAAVTGPAFRTPADGGAASFSLTD